MNLGNLITLARLYVPEANTNKVSDTNLTLLLNEGAKDVAARTICLKTNATFDVAASTATYNLSSKVTSFLVIDTPGLYWYDGSNWKKLTPYTLAGLDKDYPYWRDDSAADPLRYSVDGDIITIHPTPDTALTNGFKIYYGKKPTVMSSSDHYPFGTTVEIPHLAILSDTILAYVKWKLTQPVGKEFAETNQAKYEYLSDIEGKKKMLSRRPDIITNSSAIMRGTRIATTY